MNEIWADYMRRIAAGDTQSEITARTGIEQSSISRWYQGRNTPRAEFAVAFARAYRRNPVEALIVAGYLKQDEAGGVIELETSLSAVPTGHLLDALRRRINDLERTAVDAGAFLQWPAHWVGGAEYRGDRTRSRDAGRRGAAGGWPVSSASCDANQFLNRHDKDQLDGTEGNDRLKSPCDERRDVRTVGDGYIRVPPPTGRDKGCRCR